MTVLNNPVITQIQAQHSNEPPKLCREAELDPRTDLAVGIRRSAEFISISQINNPNTESANDLIEESHGPIRACAAATSPA